MIFQLRLSVGLLVSFILLSPLYVAGWPDHRLVEVPTYGGDVVITADGRITLRSDESLLNINDQLEIVDNDDSLQSIHYDSLQNTDNADETNIDNTNAKEPATTVGSFAAPTAGEGKYTFIPQWQPRHVHIAYGHNSSEVVITWSTHSFSGLTTVEWGLQLFDLSHTTTGHSKLFRDGGSLHASQWVHRVHLQGLASDTTYYYHVGGRHGWSPVYGFRTVPSGSTSWPLRMAVYGDLGAINAHSLVRLQQEAHQGMYDAVLHVGDMAYNMDSDNGAVGDLFMDQIEPIAAYLPYMTCPGNHEHKYDFLQYRARFSMPNYTNTESLYYSFDLGPVHFIAITTEIYYFGPKQMQRIREQYDWLINDLEAASSPSARAEHPWIVLFGHRPMYCSTNDHDDCTKNNTVTRVGILGTGRYALEPLLAEYGVDLVVWAHEHTYERLYPVYNNTVYKGSEEQPYTNPGAPTHIITGSAGCNEHLDGFFPDQPAWSAARLSEYGYTRLTFTNDTHMNLQQVADSNGTTVDEIWLVRETHDRYPLLQL